MNEKYILDKITEVIGNLRAEYADYKGQYKLLTHVINLEFLMGKYFAYMDILSEDIPHSEKAFDSTYIKVYEQHRNFIEVVTEYVNKQYNKLKEV